MSGLTRKLVPKALRNFVRSAEVSVRDGLGLVDSDQKLVRDAKAFWNDTDSEAHQYISHWRGGGDFSDDEKWLSIGRQHLAMFERFARGLGFDRRPLDRIVEWGCGGGANAVHFAPLAREFVGVDIVQATLDECGRQLATVPGSRFVPVLIDATNPESAFDQIPGPCDLFISYYVFEALPSAAYARRVLDVARKLLVKGGLAIIQIKYRTIERRTASRRWSYAKNMAHNTTYGIDEFWLEAQSVGFIPEMVTLVPEQPDVRDERYAYFALRG